MSWMMLRKSTTKKGGFSATDVICLCLHVFSSQLENLCILNLGLGLAVSMSLCSFQAGLCHNDPLFFIHERPCNPADVAKLEWAKFRASVASKSSVRQPCGLDTCYLWETCSGEWAQLIFHGPFVAAGVTQKVHHRSFPSYSSQASPFRFGSSQGACMNLNQSFPPILTHDHMWSIEWKLLSTGCVRCQRW